MKYFVPNLKLSADLPAQNQLVDKLGGLPWGLKSDQYPICSHCGKSQSLLAQLTHHPERLDLGRSGRVLLVFQCNHDPGECPTWEGGAGANACLVLDPEELINKLASLPTDLPLIEPEARITGWISEDDAITSDQASAFLGSEEFWDLPNEVTDGVYFATKLGSVPAWIQSPSEAPGEDWVFVGQLSAFYQFAEEPANQTGVSIYPSSNGWACEGPNFGDGGIGYIFLRYGAEKAEKPEGWFFWQCG